MRRPARSGRSRFFRAWVHGLQSSFGIKPVNDYSFQYPKDGWTVSREEKE